MMMITLENYNFRFFLLVDDFGCDGRGEGNL